MIPDYLHPLANHLWQSTMFALSAALLTLLLRKQRAAIRHWIWLLASMKFLVPFSLLVSLGNQLPQRPPVIADAPRLTVVMDQIGRPFSTASIDVSDDMGKTQSALPVVLFSVWLGGALITAAVWFLRWWRIRAVQVRAATVDLDLPIPVLVTSERLEPGVFGIWKPALLVPDGIFQRLSPEQMKAVLAHELCHLRRRDNLATAVHSITDVLFWFYPLVWWIGSRMIAEQERACDEEVLSLGHSSEIYAEGILKVCSLYVASSFPGRSGIGGSDLKQRISEIIRYRPTRKLNSVLKSVLAASGVLAIVWPVLVGAAQEKSNPRPRFEVATVKPTRPGNDVSWAWCRGSDQGLAGPWLMGSRGTSGQTPARPGLGRCEITGTTLKGLVGMAYDYRTPNQIDQQIVGGPSWIKSEKFDVEAKAEKPEAATEEILAEMLQQLLADRFKLKVHRDTKSVPGYRLIVAKNGSKLKKVDPPDQPPIHGRPGEMEFNGVPLEALTTFLAMTMGGPVQDKTGLTAHYAFSLRWTPDEHEFRPNISIAPDPSAPPLLTALQEQLGLKLESAKVPIDVIVIDSVAKPQGN